MNSNPPDTEAQHAISQAVQEKRKVITLCGSTKFQVAFNFFNAYLSLQGHAVFSCGLFGHSENITLAPEVKEALDAVHREKIKLSDEIFVIDVNHYVGESTLREITFANSLCKPVRYMTQEFPNYSIIVHRDHYCWAIGQQALEPKGAIYIP